MARLRQGMATRVGAEGEEGPVDGTAVEDNVRLLFKTPGA